MTSLLADKLNSQKIQVTPHCFLKKQVVEGVVANIQKIDFPNTKASFLKYAINENGNALITSPPPNEAISYTLPDNQEVHLDQDAYYLPEVMMTGTTGVGLK